MMHSSDGQVSSVTPAAPAQAPDRKWAAFWAVSIGFFMIMLDTTIIAVAQPSIQLDLNTTLSGVLWANSSYLLAYAVPMLLSGRLGDRFGPRNIYILGVITFTLASILCGVSTTITSLIAARALQGLGAAFMGPQTLSVVIRVFPPAERGAALATWGAVAGAATFSGPLLGGVIVALLHWSWIFYVNVPFGLLAILLTLRNVPKFKPNPHRFDLLGVILSGLGLLSLVFSLQQGQHFKWDYSIQLTFALAFVALLLFVLTQRKRGADALVPLSLFMTRDFTISILSLLFLSIAVNAQIVPVMFYLQRVAGLSTLMTAILTVAMPAAGVLLARTVGKTIKQVSAPLIVGPAFVVVAIGSAILLIAMSPDQPLWLITIGYAIFGVGAAFIWSPTAAYATRDVPNAMQGAASGVFNTFRIVGAVLGYALIALVIERLLTISHALDAIDASSLVLSGDVRDAYALALSQSGWLPIGALAVGALLSFFLTKRPLAPRG
jgi:EmrB/QacA subfamily drug resistance transporter